MVKPYFQDKFHLLPVYVIKKTIRILVENCTMTTKLTLSIDEKTIERAKIISSKQGKSISKMVEEYLNSITEKSEKKVSAVASLSGLLKDKAPADLNWKYLKSDYLKKKHGI